MRLWSQGLQSFQTLEGAIDIAGGTAHIPVMKDAAEAIMKANPKIHITSFRVRINRSVGVALGIVAAGKDLFNIQNAGNRCRRSASVPVPAPHSEPPVTPRLPGPRATLGFGISRTTAIRLPSG
jgi:hypothetical protein